jgi:FKBP-type peptidyl-prolyl cis-trans isomerase
MRGKFYAAAALAASLLLTGCSEEKKTYTMTPEANTQYLTDNKAKDGVKTTASGLQYRVITAGTGKSPTSPADLVTVTYKGWTVDGKVFDQTQPGDTAQFPAGRLIPGWVEALQLMKEGDEWELTIPANLAYGDESPSPDIPPGSTLIFEMKLITVTPGSSLQ